MNIIKNYKWVWFSLVLLIILLILKPAKGILATQITVQNLKSVALILPPIFVLIGLMDTWVPREVMIRFMGEKSGLFGALIALFLGAMGAGPLYVAFPVAAILVKKGARLAYVFLFLGAWVSIKLPIFMYELASFGAKFTFLHVFSSLIVFGIGSLLMEKLMSKENVALIIERADKLSA